MCSLGRIRESYVRQEMLRLTGTVLNFPAPEVTIVDESGREVTERYYKAGSALELTCIATQVGNVGTGGENRPVTWRQGDRTLTMGIRFKKTQTQNKLNYPFSEKPP
ncbi:hypothetical protein FQA39_LY04533 [Lamprigera yunnana]|nr:hypothetical protein FQA39_LY04533 [Lamprigera yunnana]